MRIAVTGSIATDHLTTFPGRFADQLIPEALDRVSLSFLVDELHVRRGGVAANVAYGLAGLGLRPVLVGAVGRDFAEYGSWLRDRGVDTASVLVSEAHHTARFLCITDQEGNQIASFYAGAMRDAARISLSSVADRLGGLDLVLVGANDPEAMARHTAECREHGHPFIADPSQQLARLDGAGIRDLVADAAYLFTNEYERALLLGKTGWRVPDVLAQVGTWVTTLGEKGSQVLQRGEPPRDIPAVSVPDPVDPTGVGDAFRAGFLAAVARGLGSVRAAQSGSVLAAAALCTVGPQDYRMERDGLMSLCRSAYGPEAADDLHRHLPRSC